MAEAEPGGAPFADAVVVAAGASARMGGADKLSERLDDRSVLEWSVAAMRSAAAVKRVIVVTRPERIDDLSRLEWLEGVELVPGGKERSDSVRSGVEAASAEVVLVHDAARPLVSARLIEAVAEAAAREGAAVPVVAVVDSIKRADSNRLVESVERAGLVHAQTPQGARRTLLVEALEATVGQAFADEAALLESRGVPVATVAGEPMNLKLTEPGDLDLARALVRGRPEARFGFGFGQDSHAFGPDDGLWLGGVLIEQAPRLFGHSDGDVVLHALATAVLSASGLGDLGRLFAAGDRATKGIASSELLREAVARGAAAGWHIESAQVSLVGARPRLGGTRIDRMRERVAEILGVTIDAVSLTASTGNLSGPEGAGRVVSATALVAAHQR